MIIGDRLRALREEKKLSQGDIESGRALVAPIFLALKIIIVFQISRPWRNGHGL